MEIKQKEKKHREGILQFLWEEGFATADQIKKHIFRENTEKSKTYRRKLLKLENKALIKRQPVLFSKSGVYYLTKTGWNSLDIPQAHKISPTSPHKISTATGPHRLKVIDARLEIERIAPMQDYYSERTLAIYPGKLLRRPDFLFTADEADGKKRIAVEIELTYRNIKKTKQIIAYWAYALQKNRIDAVIFLSDTKAKADRLKQIIIGLKNQMITISVPTTLFGEKTHRQDKILIQQEDTDKFHTAKIGEIAQSGLFGKFFML